MTALLAFVLMAAAVPQRGAPPIVDPTQHRSASGVFVLDIEPIDRTGSGAAVYRMERDGALVWSAEHPWCLRHVEITDDGRVVGVAGIGLARTWSDAGTLAIVALDAEGRVVLDRRVPRTVGGHGSVSPTALGLLVHEAARRFTARVGVKEPSTGRSFEEWWTFELDTGASVRELRLDALPETTQGWSRRLTWARTLAGTGLVLAQVSAYRDAVFTLLDEQGCAVWSTSFSSDGWFEDRAERERGYEWTRAGNALAGCEANGRFDVQLLAGAERITFEARPSATEPGGWSVREIARTASVVDLDPAPPSPAPERIWPKLVRKVALSELPVTEPDPQRRVLDVDVAHSDEVHVLRSLPGESGAANDPLQSELFVLAPDGQLLRRCDVRRTVGARRGVIALADGSSLLWGGEATISRVDARCAALPERTIASVDDVEVLVLQPGALRAVVVTSGHTALGTLNLAATRPSVEKRIHRRPDGKFFRCIDAVAVASDGRVAVVDEGRVWIFDVTMSGGRRLDFELPSYSPSSASSVRHRGRARPPWPMSFSAEWIHVGSPIGVHWMNVRDGRHFLLLTGAGHRQTSIVRPELGELWVVDTVDRTLARFQLPP